MNFKHLILHQHLRKELKSPQGELIRGDKHETTLEAIRYIEDNNISTVVAVGDVCSVELVKAGYNPFLILTDGYTKREKLDEYPVFQGYITLNAVCKAGEISIEAQKKIFEIFNNSVDINQYHLKIDGEEDLLVLPLIREMPDNALIIYGQPNEGIVLRIVNSTNKKYAIDFMNRM